MEKVFVPITHLEIIGFLFSVVAKNYWSIYQLDMKSAFLNGFLEKEVYAKQPLGYVIKGKEDKVLKLKKASYGIK